MGGDFQSVRAEVRRAFVRFLAIVGLVLGCIAITVFIAGCAPQEPLTWDKVRAIFSQQQAAPAEPAPQPAPAPVATSPADRAPDPPRAALAFRDDLIRTARAVWGMGAPVAVFAAQIHQESGWNPQAVSKVGAAGMAQFMPATAKWIAQRDEQLADAQPLNPAWAMRALVVYDQYLYERAPARYTPSDRMWVALRAYNGGLGHWQAEAAATGQAQPTRERVDEACGRARRAALHCRENLGYPQRILQVLQPRYLRWGPGL